MEKATTPPSPLLDEMDLWIIPKGKKENVYIYIYIDIDIDI